MFWTIVVDGKVRRVSFWKWLAYMNQKKLERIEKKVDFITKNKKEELMQNEMNCAGNAADEAKERVKRELFELNEKIVKLTAFLYGPNISQAVLSHEMVGLMEGQLSTMTQYAKLLQRRLAIWGKSDEELMRTYQTEKIGCY